MKKLIFNFLIKITKHSYHIKPLIPRALQLFFRRRIIRFMHESYKHIWPIDPDSGGLPDNWKGWPERKRFAFVLTHDIETAAGQEKCKELMSLEEKIGFHSSFNFVPEKYRVSSELHDILLEKGFEVGVHGLNHDGKLYHSKKIFTERAKLINHYIHEWNARGFRSPAMHHNLDWIGYLNIEYDASTFDTDPFEPQPDGVHTIFPFYVRNNSNPNGFVELPYTLPQDFTLFVLMKEKRIDIWKRKLDWIIEKGGMALLNTHPDYMNFEGGKLSFEEYPVQLYEEFLSYVKNEYKDEFWHVLPGELAKFTKENYEMMKRIY